MKKRIEPRLPDGNKIGITGDDLKKFEYLIKELDRKPTELVRHLIRKEYKTLTGK